MALEAPFQVFLTITMISLNIIQANLSSYQSTYVSIDLNWLPVVSISLSAIAIFTSLLRTSAELFKGKSWIGIFAIVFPIFVFRMVTWQILMILLADLTFVVLAVVILSNTALLLIIQKNSVSFEPFSYAVLSLVFPMSKLISKSKNLAIVLRPIIVS